MQTFYFSKEELKHMMQPPELYPQLLQQLVKKSDYDRINMILAAAIKYIELTPCEPDVYPEQWQAFFDYKKALAVLE